MKLIPLEDRVIVRPAKPPEKTPGGLILPDVAKEEPLEGEVLAAGPGRLLESGKRMPHDVKAGDVVLFGRYSGQEYKKEGETLRVLTATEVLAKMEK